MPGILGTGAWAETAAEIDWVVRDELADARRAELLWFESGAYVAPTPASDVYGPVTAWADDTDQVIGEYVDLRGDVRVERGPAIIQATRLRYDERTREAEVEGPLIFRDAGVLMTGATATANLFDGAGTVNDATFLLHESAMRGAATRITRLADESMVLDNAELTRCEPGVRSWQMTTPDLRLDPVAGKGSARNVVVRIRDVPVFYAPYLGFPLDDRRKSGLLSPSGGHDSDSGVELGIPYYFNIAPQVDATWEIQSLWKRGILHDGQLRFLLGETRNEINVGYLPKDDLYDPRTVIDETDPDATFERQDRWYLNLRHESDYAGSKWLTNLDYNAVSDVDYLSDLDGRVGTDDDRFASTVGANVTDWRAPALNRFAEVRWQGRPWRHSLQIQAFQLLDETRPPQYEKLPEFVSDYRSRIGGLDISASFQFARFDKDHGDIPRFNEIVGDRALLDATIAWPRRTSWGYITPAVGGIARQYRLENVPAGIDDEPSSTIPRLSLDAGLIFDRFFSSGGARWQQTLEPRFYYLYVESEDQSEFPLFDVRPSSPSWSTLFRTNRYSGYDRVADANQISLGLTTRFITRADGAEVLSASIGQTRYLQDRDVNYLLQVGDDPTRAASPLFLQARLQLAETLSIAGSYEFEPDVNLSNRGTFSMQYRSSDHRSIMNLVYVYANPLVQRLGARNNEEESDLSVIFPLGPRLSVIGRWNFNWDRHQTLESFAGIEYNDCCLKTRVVFRRFLEFPRDVTFITDTPDGPVAETREIMPADTGIFFEIQLKGLGTLGRRLDLLLERGIPGYRQREDLIGF